MPENPASEETTHAFDAVVNSYWESEDPAASRAAGELFKSALAGLADGLTAKGAAMVGEARYAEGIAALDSAIDQFMDNVAPRLRTAVALALSHKITALVRTGRMDEALQAREYMVMHYGGVGVAVPEVGGEIG